MLSASAVAQVSTGQIAVTPNAAAYVSGYCLGGVIAVPNLVRVGQNGGTQVIGATIVDSTATNAAVDILVFSRKPTGTYADHAACAVATADLPYLAGAILNTTFIVVSPIEQATPQITIVASNAAGTPPVTSALWFVPIVRATPTYGASATLWFTFSSKFGTGVE